MITCNHALPIDAKPISQINIVLNSENKTILLKNRKKWTDIYKDYTIIEIKENEDNIHNFLISDDNVFKNNYSNENYLNQNVAIFAFKNIDEQLGFSNGIIKKCYEYYFSYNGLKTGIFLMNVIKDIKENKNELLSNVNYYYLL